MKLLRFATQESPAIRTGIFHENNVYETDGERALGVHKPDAVQLLPPVGNTRSLRFFDAFAPREGKPLFAFGNVSAIKGPDEEIIPPRDSRRLDFEMQVAAVVGVSDFNLTIRDAEEAILGLTILNIWTSRDPNLAGTAKERDFAISVGPFLVTPDELADKVTDRTHGNQYSLNMKALVNGEVVASANLSDMRYTFAELLVEASNGSPVSEGDLIASGCAPGGSLLQLEKDFLQPGDEVSIVVERLGALVNKVA